MSELSTLRAAATYLIKDLDAHGEHLTPAQIAGLTSKVEAIMYAVWNSDPESVTPVEPWRVAVEADERREQQEIDKEWSKRR